MAIESADNLLRLSAFATLDDLGDAWQRLQPESDAPDVSATFAGFRAWVTHFSDVKDLPMLQLTIGGEPVALMPIAADRWPLTKLGIRWLRSPGNFYWTSGYPIVGAADATAVSALLSALIRRPGWDVLELGPIDRADHMVANLTDHGGRLGMTPEIRQVITDHFIAVDGDWSSYYAKRSANVRSMVGRGERRLAQRGPLAIRECTGGDDLQNCLDEFFRIEASGWKAKEGTAINCDPATRAFYSDLASLASQRGMFKLYLLFVGDVCVAGEYCLELKGRITMLKSGYEDSWSKSSPGHVLKKLILQRLFEGGRPVTYGLGTTGSEHMNYKGMWATNTRDAVILRLFNPASLRSRLARKILDLKRRKSRTHIRADLAATID